MPYYDELIKHLMDRFPYVFAVLALKTTEVEVGDRLSTEQHTIKVHHSDMTFRISLPEGEAILHIEAQTDESREKPMPLRMLAYASFLALEYELDVYSTVLYFRPPAGRRDPGFYGYGDDTRGGLWFKYTVVRLYELEGEAFLDRSSVGLLPFTPLMKPPAGVSSEAWIARCIETTRHADIDRETQATLLFALSVFGSLVHPPELFQSRILEEIMQESPFYERVMQRGLEQGIEQGARETTVKNILTVLKRRFPESNISTSLHALEQIDDIEHLEQLLDTALLVSTFNGFLRALEP